MTFEAQQRAWLDAATRQDDKWDLLLGEVMPEASRHIACQLGLSQAGTVTFAPNTHELVLRLLSCPPVPARILTTGSEFHSFARQACRLEEAGLAVVERVAAEPFATARNACSTPSHAVGTTSCSSARCTSTPGSWSQTSP